jgi:hypothetical protein
MFSHNVSGREHGIVNGVEQPEYSETYGKMRFSLNSGQTNAVKTKRRLGGASGMLAEAGGDYRGRTRGE